MSSQLSSTFAPKIHVIDEDAAMAREVAEYIVGLAREKQQQQAPRLTVALAGGSTPKAVYQYMAKHHPAVVAEGIEFFFGDVRMVPDDHNDSNFKMVRESLFTVPDPSAGGWRQLVPPSHIHAIDVSAASPSEAAKAYENDILAYFASTNADVTSSSLNQNDGAKGEEEGVEEGRAKKEGAAPSFDVIMLGFGPDGHTASLFPHTPAPLERARLVTDCMPTANVSPYVARVTMTRRLIAAAKSVVAVAKGAEKKWVLDGIVNGTPSPNAVANRLAVAADTLTSEKDEADLPVAALLRECKGIVHLFVDSAAAPSPSP